MTDKLVTMRRGKTSENDVAIVREDWVEEWKGYGYKVVKGGEADASEPTQPTDATDPSEPSEPQA